MENIDPDLAELLDCVSYAGAPVDGEGNPIWLTPETDDDPDDEAAVNINKFNENHDELGRFAESANSKDAHEKALAYHADERDRLETAGDKAAECRRMRHDCH
jgi:hypothetical protein